MDSVFQYSYAKINLTLDVLDRRDDGYHNIRSVMQTISLCDGIAVKRNRTGEIVITANLPFLCTGESNICHKTAALYFQTTGIVNEGVDIHIDKVIPIGAGLGGGSANAACVIRALEKLFAPLEDRIGFAAQIGADVPFCLHGKTALCEGIGDVLTPIESEGKPVHLVIAKNARKIPNRIVYEKYDALADRILVRPDHRAMEDALRRRQIDGICRAMRNVFEDVVIPELPSVGRLKKKLLECGALGVMMSGSGPSVYGIFEKEADARRCAKAIRTGRVNAFTARFL